ncbi:MAG: peroxide stress protein YaaA [Eubacterium sp.]|nr:peroxide stress protein YaaA [Eubacterium sp.]
MKIIISPAKKMKTDTDAFEALTRPVFLKEAGMLLDWMLSLSYAEAKKLWACSDSIAGENYARIRSMDLHRALTPAILSYDGIQYTYMAPAVFEESQHAYIQEHLRIMSGFYGVLKPMDGVTPYRLEMQAKADIAGSGSLYGFWGSSLYEEVRDGSGVIINLASKEYSRCIERYLCPADRYITCVFGELENGKVVQKGVYAKMARGEMVRFMAERQIHEPEQLKAFCWSGYRFDEIRSGETEYVFVREAILGKHVRS